MISNVFLDFFIVLFIVLSAAVLYKERKTRLGVIVKENGRNLTSGRQGLETEIGRSPICDVRLLEKSVSRLQAKTSYDSGSGDILLDDIGANPGNRSAGYFVSNHDLKLFSPIEERCFELGYLPCISAMMVIVLQAVLNYRTWDTPLAIVPHIVIICFLVVNYFLRADRTPIIEATFSIFLTFYVEATMYPAVHDPELLSSSMISAITGVTAYTILCLFMKLFCHILTKRPYLYRSLRIAACGIIVLLILINLILAKPINGARNWVNVGGLSFQPSEAVKVLLAFALIIPPEERADYMNPRNLAITIGIPAACMVYALLIKDVGVLLQFGVIFILAVLLQNTDILKNVLIIVSAFFSCKLVLKVSSTAVYRFSNWIGEGTVLEGLTGKGIFDTPFDYGYQSVHAVVAAFNNGGLLGNKSGFDVMSGIEAANSDLVIGFLSQKHGFLFPFLLLGLYLILLGGCLILSLRQQRKMEQVFSIVAISVICFAMALNMGGTFGIVALSGVVSPALSDGISAALCYGPLFGVISASGLTHNILRHIKGAEKT